MGWMGLVASLVSSLVWPAVVIAALWLYRRPLSELLGRVAEARGFGASLTFRERLANVASQVATAAGVDSVFDDSDDSDDSPRDRIADAWSRLQSGLVDLVARAGRSDETDLSTVTPVGLAAELAQSAGALPSYVEATSEMAALHSEAQEGLAQVSKRHAKTFERAVDNLLRIGGQFVEIRDERTRRASDNRPSQEAPGAS